MAHIADSYSGALVRFGGSGIMVYKGTAGEIHEKSDELIRKKEEMDENYIDERENEGFKWGER
jgi:hypothetical protein